jgi:hypothetical protein
VIDMLRGHVAVFLSCSEKFKQAVAWPVRDALAERGMLGIIVSDEPPLPGAGQDAEANVESYLDASSAFVALCTQEYGLSDGTTFPRANIIEEIERARVRPHLRDRCQILKSPGVLLPSSINPTYDRLDITRPAGVAEVILQQLEAWEVVPRPPGPPAPTGVPDAGDPGAGVSSAGVPGSGVPGSGGTDADAAGDLATLFVGLQPGDHDEARRRVYLLLRDRGEARRQWIARALHGEVLESGDHARQLTAASLLEAMSRLDASLVSVGMIEMLAAGQEYPPRSCAANLLRDRAVLAPLEVPAGVLGRLALPSGQDWYVWAPAMAAVKELALTRPDAYVIFESLAASAEPQDRHAVARALLDVAAVKPAAVPAELAGRLLDDPDPLIAQQAGEVMTAIEHVTDAERAGCCGRFWR